MPKSYLSGVSYLAKMSAFLKPAGSPPPPMTKQLESTPAFISADAEEALEIGTEQNRTSETTMLTVALSIISMDSGNGNEDISINSAVMQGDIENNVELIT